MAITLQRIFKKNKNIVIGVIHLPPLLGHPQFPGMEVTLRNALVDLHALEQGGVDGIIFENNYDVPHSITVESRTIGCMALVGKELRATTRLPLGVSVLWNDFESGLALAKLLNLQFIRIPVFVDTVKANCGVIQGDPQKVHATRKRLHVENVALFTDIHVKHSQLLSKNNLVTSAKLAQKNGSDAVILTGNWTGLVPETTDMQAVRKVLGAFPIFVGSGATKENVKSLLEVANGVIVSTALKEGKGHVGEVNVKPYTNRIQKSKVQTFVKQIQS